MATRTPNNNKQIFDSALFGLLIRKARRDAGYPTAEALSRAVFVMTGYTIPKDTIHRIENGSQEMTSVQRDMVSLTLWGEIGSENMTRLMGMCFDDPLKQRIDDVENNEASLWIDQTASGEKAVMLDSPHDFTELDKDGNAITDTLGRYLPGKSEADFACFRHDEYDFEDYDS